MYQFRESVVHTENDNEEVVLVSFEHDDILFVTGKLRKAIIMFDQGVTLVQLKEFFSNDQLEEEQIIQLISLLHTRKMLKESDFNFDDFCAEKLRIEDVGEIRVQTFKYNELQAYATKVEEI